MIANFADFEHAVFNGSTPFSADNLSLAEQTILKSQISMAEDSQLKSAYDVLGNYYGITVPRDFLIEVMYGDLDLAMEIMTGGVSDTCQREILIDRITKKLINKPWPIYGDGDKAYEEFIKELKVAIHRIGGKMEDYDGA